MIILRGSSSYDFSHKHTEKQGSASILHSWKRRLVFLIIGGSYPGSRESMLNYFLTRHGPENMHPKFLGGIAQWRTRSS
jgi:hypothetical protein